MLAGLRCGHSTNRRFDLVHDQVDRVATQGRRLESALRHSLDLGVCSPPATGRGRWSSSVESTLNSGWYGFLGADTVAGLGVGSGLGAGAARPACDVGGAHCRGIILTGPGDQPVE